MRNILTIDVEDYFQVSAFSPHISRTSWDQFESRVEQNTARVLACMARKGTKATFFVLGWVAERYPQLVKVIQAEGHEVACHGYSHCLVYEQTPREFRGETRRAKAVLEDITGCAVCSYRAASYSITRKSAWALQILAEEGFKYDSSIFPIVHDRYGIPDAPRHPIRIKLASGYELLEFPLSTLKLWGLNLPISGGGYFRLFPYMLTHLCIRRLNKMDALPVIFYLHPWEFDPDQPVQKVGRLSRFRHYLNLHKTEARFERLLASFEFAPLVTVAAETLFAEVEGRWFLGTGQVEAGAHLSLESRRSCIAKK